MVDGAMFHVFYDGNSCHEDPTSAGAAKLCCCLLV
jgi:hypothetical protein